MGTMFESVAFILKGYPRLSETFIAQEILALEQSGLDIVIISLRKPTDVERHPVHREIKAPVLYLPEFILREPVRVVRAWLGMRQRPGYLAARDQWLRDCRRAPSMQRLRGFAQALVLADELPSRATRLHAHYLHWPASVARYAGMVLGLPWSCSAHARDIWVTPEWEKREKLKDAAWLVTCTVVGQRHLASLVSSGDEASRIELVYHGLDFCRLPEPRAAFDARIGGKDKPAIFLSVGRAVEKKGYATLLSALARLPRHLHWRLVHIGDGPLLPRLRCQADRIGIGDRVTWLGAQAHDTVVDNYRTADVFVLASCIAGDGDRDGLPNVLMEAQSQGLACVSTELSAIPELIEDGVTGLLVPPQSEDALAEALAQMITDHELRARLAAAGCKRVRERFSHDSGVDRLARKFGLSVPMVRECA
jgi:glycosyltransferase involved in cell wall biosynthesis